MSEQVGQDEIWQCGVRCSFEEPFDEELYVTEVAANVAAWYSSAEAQHHPNTRLLWIKAARIAASGKYPTPTYHAPEALYADAVGGGGVSTGLPSFCCLAYSWLSSDHRRGPASHGRIYPPNFGIASPAGSSHVNAATTDLLVTAAKRLLTAIQNGDGTQITSPGIFSNVGAAASVITSVRVGNVLDTQRRRKNAAAEIYSAGAFP